MEIDPNTGLPALTDGFFWRVKQSPAGDAYPLRVYLMRREFLFFNVSYRWAYATDDEGDVLSAARMMYRRAFPAKFSKSNLVGDYPPRKLGDN